MTPGARIKLRRIELGLSQMELARSAGMAQSSLSELERGDSHMPSAENLMSLAKVLGVSKSWIMTGRDGQIETLTADEENMMQRMRRLTAEQRRAVYVLIESMGPDDAG